MAFVYILLSEKDNKTYTGSTDNLLRRLNEHNTKKVKSTSYRTPLKLIYKEEYKDLTEARKREHYLKSSSGRRELKKLISKIICKVQVLPR